MASNNTKWTPLQPRQLVKFYDPNNPANSFTPQFNPQQITISPGNVRQYQATTNGAAVIIGKREYPPTAIQLVWNQFDVSDFNGIAPFTNLSPIVYVDNNDNGYLGVLTIQSAAQLAGMSSNVWTSTMNFLVIGPYNGQTHTLPQLTIPSLYIVETNGNFGSTGAPGFTYTAPGPGFIPIGTTLHFWLTMTSRWGETLVGFDTHVTTTKNNDALALYWAVPPPDDPNNVYYQTSKLYWYTANTSSAATFLSEVQAGFDSSGVDSFIAYAPYVAYSLINPPIFSSAFMGYWAGGLFIPDPNN